MNTRIKILDHGYIELIEHWGSDARIIESARMSTDKGFKGWGPMSCKYCGAGPNSRGRTATLYYGRPECQHIFPDGDEKLLRYLYEHRHSTPFEFAGLTVQVKAPIMVFRQWHRHRTQSYNEMSARYTPIPNEHYFPSIERLLMKGGKNKQAQGQGQLSDVAARAWLVQLQARYEAAELNYQGGLAAGVPKELARLAMPVGRYSKMRASANLRNWLAFLTLRMDSHAQWEIRQYANAIGKFIAKNFPRTWELFIEKSA